MNATTESSYGLRTGEFGYAARDEAAPQRVEIRCAWPPEVGGIYRDGEDRSMLVLGVSAAQVFVEFPDGHTGKFDKARWQRLAPTPSRC